MLEEFRGAFVSLHRRGQLRGCIGYIDAVKPLLQTVMEMAPAAAFQDPRFRPLQADELADLEIEISVLTPMRLVKSPDEIKVGQHGLYIVKGSTGAYSCPRWLPSTIGTARPFWSRPAIRRACPQMPGRIPTPRSLFSGRIFLPIIPLNN